MIPYFVFNNINSLDRGIVVNKLPPIIKAERNINKIEVVGRNGFLTQDYNTYKSFVKPVECTLMDMTRIDEVCAWLAGSSDVIFSNEENKVYKATIINQIPFERIIPEVSEFIIQFECQPFKYDRYDTEIIKITENNVTRNSKVIHPLVALNYTGGNLVEINKMATINESNSMEIFNSGTMESKPTITIYATGDVTLNINEETIKLKNVENYITLDSEMMECYKDVSPQNNKMYGKFPILKTGKNIISWEGHLKLIKIKKNTCYL